MDLALEEPELSPRELAVRFTDTQRYFVSEASIDRLLIAHDLVTSPAFAIIKAGDEFHESEGLPATGSRAGPELPARTSSGRPTSPASRPSGGDGSTCRRSLTTTAGTSSPGASARR